MSSKMFIFSFFSRKVIKVFDENIPGFVSIQLVFNGLQTVDGQNEIQRAINDTRLWIWFLSSETIGHLKKLNKCVYVYVW